MPESVTPPPNVEALYAGVSAALDTLCDNGQPVGNCSYGVYLFYDYDGEPIYVGQTKERIRTRIRRHLTNQRTDAVAMSVLDPFEVAEIEMWPFWSLDGGTVSETLNRAEFTVYCHALSHSEFHAVLNEGDIPETEAIQLPPSVRVQLFTGDRRRERKHPDIRLARRARTIANLARIISERKVTPGIRRTLWAQAQRLESLARKRLQQTGGKP